MNVYEIAADFRARVLAGEEEAIREILRIYELVRRRLLADAIPLLRQAAALPEGSWQSAALSRLDELAEMLGRYSAEFAQGADAAVAAAQADGARLGAKMAQELMRARGGAIGATFARVPEEAVQRLAGALGDGSPLRRLFDRFGPVASLSGRDSLQTAIGAGFNPRKVVDDLERALRTGEPDEGFAEALLGATGELRDRALVIARTEILRAHRSAALANYEANADVLDGWEWHAHRGPRTCAVCLAMDGSRHPIDEPFATHVQCRCAPIPYFEGIDDDGRGSGEAWFAEQPEDYQLNVLGPGKLELYRDGRIRLADLVKKWDDPEWGPQRAEKSLAAIKRELGIDDEPPAPRSRPKPKPKAKPIPAPKAPPAPKQAPMKWRPVMNRKDADRWASGSAIQDEQYHITEAANVKAIETEGFKLEGTKWARVWGEGVYMSSDPKALDLYERIKRQRGPIKKLAIKVNVAKPLKVSIPDGSFEPFWRILSNAAGYDSRQMLDEIIAFEDSFWDDYSEFRKKGMDPDEMRARLIHRYGRCTLDDVEVGVVVDRLKRDGYDSIDIVDEAKNGINTNVGGSQLVVFDPKKVVIVK